MADSEGEKREQLRQELKALRRGRGTTFAKLDASPVLKQLFGENGARAVYDALVSRIEELSDDTRRDALLVALGFDDRYSGRTLTSRRGSYAGAREKDPDTIESYEDSIIEDLVVDLIPNSDTAPKTLSIVLKLSEGRLVGVRRDVFPYVEGLPSRIDQLSNFRSVTDWEASTYLDEIPQGQLIQDTRLGVLVPLADNPQNVEVRVSTDLSALITGSGNFEVVHVIKIGTVGDHSAHYAFIDQFGVFVRVTWSEQP